MMQHEGAAMVMPAGSIAVVGLGAMGLPMSLRLMQAGFDVRGVDRAAASRERFTDAGGAVASTVSDAVRGADALLLLVVNADQAEDVLFGPDGAVDAIGTKCIVLLALTTSPESAAAIGRKLADRGVRMIDAPVSGGVKRAAAGTLTVLASGPPDDISSARHFLAPLGAVHEIGPDVGQASAVKLINQLLCGVHLAAAAEAIALAEHLAVDPRKVYEVVKMSSGISHMFADRVPLMLGEESRLTAAIDILVKDLALVCDLATSAGACTPTARRALDLFREAALQGLGGFNDSEIIRCLRSPVSPSSP
jgi:3-hydroxyisobutyrate dehydrogenase